MNHTPNHLTAYEWRSSKLECRSENGVILRIDVLADKIIRVRYGLDCLEDDFSYAISPTFVKENPKTQFLNLDSQLVIITDAVQCKIKKVNLQVSFFTKEGLIINEDEKGYFWEYEPISGNNKVLISKHIQNDEIFFGLGDKPCELNLKGKSFEIWGTDHYGYDINSDPLYKNIPFYYGLHHDIAYGLFFDNSFKSFFDFGKTKPNATMYMAKGGEVNYYFIAGPQLTEVAQGYARLTGTADMPAMWALGFHQSKWSYYPESAVKDIAHKMREHHIPCDAIYLDIDYMDGFRCFTWNKDRFPNPKEMVSDLREKGFKTVVIIDPGIKKDWSYKLFEEGIRKDYFCKRPDGPYASGLVWPGECYFPDFTNPAVREWWGDQYKELIEDIGISGVWNDMNEPALFEVESRTMPSDVRHDYDGHPCSHAKAHNVYGMQMARATYEGVKKYNGNKRGHIITRSGYSGLQRYSSVWTGDNVSKWHHILIANLQCQRLSISGVSLAGSDIGGFIGQPDGQLLERWMQLGIFHPFCRIHSSQDDGAQEPWTFGTETLDIIRKALELRYQLLPYHYTAMYEHHKFGTPVLKPLVFYDQHDPNTHDRNNEFICGNDLLVAAVYNENALQQNIYLPKGSWYNYWTSAPVQGGISYNFSLNRETFPLFVAGGTILPFYPLQQYADELKIDVVVLKVYFKEGIYTSHLYEDDHDGYQYQAGYYRYSTFIFEGTADKVEIKHYWEGRFDVGYRFRFQFIGIPFKPRYCSVDGMTISHDDLITSANFHNITLTT